MEEPARYDVAKKQMGPLEVKAGQVYSHCKKGSCYKVLLIAKHTETEEEMVIYKSVVCDGLVWARPLSMWLEVLEDGLPRFRLKC